MADNKETLAQAMFGKSEEDLEQEENAELKQLAGRGDQARGGNEGTGAGGGAEGALEEASNVNEPGRAPARGLASVHAPAEPDEGGARTTGQTGPQPPNPEQARQQYDAATNHPGGAPAEGAGADA